MKKSLAIGVASAAIAAMPIVGVFAGTQTSTIGDTLSATITTACTFLRYGTAGAAGQTDVTVGPNWDGTTTPATADAATHVYSATLKPTADVELGTSNFKAYCNAPSGFNVTVATPDLSTGGTTPSIIPFANTTPNATTGEGWTLKKSDNSLVNATGDVFMSAAGPTDATTNPVTETATYTVYTKSDTKSGTYTSDVVYTFTYEDPNTP